MVNTLVHCDVATITWEKETSLKETYRHLHHELDITELYRLQLGCNPLVCSGHLHHAKRRNRKINRLMSNINFQLSCTQHRTQHQGAYRSTKLSLATSNLLTPFELTLFSTSMLDTEVGGRLSRFVATLYFTSFASTVTGAELRTSNCRFRATVNPTALPTTMSGLKVHSEQCVRPVTKFQNMICETF